MGKLKSKNAIVGLGAWLLSIASFTAQLLLTPKGEQIMWLSPLGISTIMVFIAGSVLVFWGIFKHELSHYEWNIIVTKRQEYIPLFQKVVDAMISRMRELSEEAGKLPLEQYYDKYLKLNNAYERKFRKLSITHKDKVVRRKVAIIIALAKDKGFGFKNSYLYELEDKDPEMKRLNKEYATYLARANDKPLSRELKYLFKQTRMMYSGCSIAEIAKNNDFPYKDPKYINIFYERPKTLESFVNIHHKWVNERFNVLLRGGDL